MLRGHSPVCIVDVLWPKGWIDQDATWYGGGLGPGDIVSDGDGRRREGVCHIFLSLWAPLACTRNGIAELLQRALYSAG